MANYQNPETENWIFRHLSLYLHIKCPDKLREEITLREVIEATLYLESVYRRSEKAASLLFSAMDEAELELVEEICVWIITVCWDEEEFETGTIPRAVQQLKACELIAEIGRERQRRLGRTEQYGKLQSELAWRKFNKRCLGKPLPGDEDIDYLQLPD